MRAQTTENGGRQKLASKDHGRCRLQSARPLTRRLAALSAAAMSLAQVGSSSAQLYWDLTAGASGAGGASPAGTWSTTVANWNTLADGTGALTPWAAGSNATFSAGADATGAYGVTLSGTQSAGIITVEEGNPTFSGSDLDLHGALNVGTNATAQFNNLITGTSGITKIGVGSVILTANSANAGPVNINDGRTILNGANGALSGLATLNLNGGTLELNNAANLNGNRLSDAAVINTGLGSTITLVPNASATTETIGATTFNSGQTTLSVGTMAGSDATLTLASANRTIGSTVVFTTGQLAVATIGVATAGVTPRITITSQEANAGTAYLAGYTVQTNAGPDFAVYDPALHTVRAPIAGEFVTTDSGNDENLRVPDSPGTTNVLGSSRTLNSLAISGSGTTALVGTATITTGQIIKLGGAGTATVANGSTQVLVSGNNNELCFTVGSGSLYFGGKANKAGTNTAITKAGAGTLYFYNTSPDNAGTFTINGGTVLFSGGGVRYDSAGTLVINSGAMQFVLAASGAERFNDSDAIYLNGAAAGQSRLILGSIAGTGVVEHIGTVTMQGGGLLTHGSGQGTIGLTKTVYRDGSVGAGSAQITTGQVDLNGSQIEFNVGHNPLASVDMIVSSAIHNGGMLKTGAGVLALSNTTSSDFTGGVAINDGALRIAADTNLGGTANTITLNGGTLLTAGAVVSARPVTLTADGTVDTSTFSTSFGAVAGPGTFHKQGSGALSVPSIRTTGLSVDAGTVAISGTRDAANKLSQVTTLSVASGAALDLGSNDLILDYSNGGSPDAAKLATVRALLISGYANGAWSGPGITSSGAKTAAADANVTNKTALGYSEASAAGYTSGTFDGANVDSDMILVRYTYSGDANLDGVVNAADFTLLSQNFNKANPNWVNGDFNYDNKVNALDFNALANNYGATPLLSPPALGSLVPEPASLTVSGCAVIALRRRRRSV